MRIRLTILLLIAFSISLHGQDIQTASAFFDELSNRYGDIEDYTADLTVTTENSELIGTIEYRIPNQMRIDFEEPTGQVMVSDGETLQVYIPEHNVTLEQSLQRRTDADIATMANEQGLTLLRSNYSIAFLNSPAPVPLDEGDSSDDAEMVTKLRLNWRTTDQGFRQLIISVTDDFLIRRIVGINANYEEVQFDFENLRINEGIPGTRFEYEAPSSANTFSNFLFEGEG
ncbi:MAG: outer-membrane lipoprotein carrier protein LolA [Alkalispirochaeta sp.]